MQSGEAKDTRFRVRIYDLLRGEDKKERDVLRLPSYESEEQREHSRQTQMKMSDVDHVKQTQMKLHGI